MQSITLRQLRYCDALATFGHFGRAAEACSISQPAISVQIKELEETLGVKLFERGARQVQLTTFGEDFVQRARDIIRSVDDLGDLARSSVTDFTGRLKLGIIPTVAPYLLPRIISELTLQYESLDIQVRESQTNLLLSELSAGKLDAAILALPISEPSLVELPLFTEEFLLVRHADDAGKPVPDAGSLRDMRLLLLEEGHCFRDQALSFCGMRRLLPRDRMEGSSLSTLVQMVSAGLGVTLIPQMAVTVETRSAPVSLARFNLPRPSRTIGMIWRKTSPLAAQFQDIANVVKAAAEKNSL